MDLEMPDNGGSRPLYISAGNNNEFMVSLLLGYNADIDSYNYETGRTALHEAITNGHPGVTKALVHNGANIDGLSSDGYTSLMEAVLKENLDAVRFLLKHGSKKKMRSPESLTVEDLAIGLGNKLVSAELRSTPDSSEAVNRGFKEYACRGFEATIIDFFKADNNSEVPSPTFATTSMYELLYG